jgi:hypothetical protein
VILPAQQPSPEPASESASFEVAFGEAEHESNFERHTGFSGNGSYSASNVALKSVIANAYEVRIFQIGGWPDWLTLERFDIIARGREGTPRPSAIGHAAGAACRAVQARRSFRNSRAAGLRARRCAQRWSAWSAAEAVSALGQWCQPDS